MKFKNCYGSIKCQESIDKKKKIDSQCEEAQYMYGEIPTCIKWFFKTAYTGTYDHCLMEYDFLAHNLTTKREAFISGESCVFKVLNESRFYECEPESAEFIMENYASVVEYITANQTEESCRGAHYVYQKLQCDVIKDI